MEAIAGLLKIIVFTVAVATPERPSSLTICICAVVVPNPTTTVSDDVIPERIIKSPVEIPEVTIPVPVCLRIVEPCDRDTSSRG